VLDAGDSVDPDESDLEMKYSIQCYNSDSSS